MKLTQAVEVDDARVRALTPEAFTLVLEARGWIHPWRDEDVWVGHGCILMSEGARSALDTLANAHHAFATFDAFVEVERVQALLDAVEAAEQGDADAAFLADGGLTWVGPAREARAQLPRLVRIICGLEADQ